jgi:poly(A) polymerase
MQTDMAIILKEVSSLLNRLGYQSYAVGGFVRDWFLDRKTNDVDIAVNGNAINIAQEVAKTVEGKFVLLDDMNGIARVVINEGEQVWYLDLSSFADDIESDLARRDFTINAMAAELRQFITVVNRSPKQNEQILKQSGVELIDPFSGEKDLKNKIIRGVSKKIFEVDAARLLRAVRLAAELNFVIEPGTETLVRHYSELITKIPGERIREELLKMVNLPNSAHYLRYLDELGLLLALVPELAEGKGVEQPRLHFWDVFNHSLQTVAAIEFLIREHDWEYGNEDILTDTPWSQGIKEHLAREVSSGSTHKTLLKLGGLFHDIAKPRTKFVDNTDRTHFYGHAKQGADMTAAILGRLRFSNREINLVESLVYHHLRPMQMSDKEMPTQRAIYRYFRDTGDVSIDILILALADYLASRGPLLEMAEWEKHCRLVNYILTEHDKQQAKFLPPKLISGHDLINTFGLAPGPLIGELLDLVREAEASGEVTSKEEALALARAELDKRTLKDKVS